MQKPINLDLFLAQFQSLGVADKIPPEAMKAVTARLKMHEYNKKDLLARSGEVCNRWFFIGEGLVRVFYERNGEEITELLAPEGWAYTPFESYYGGRTCKANIEALEPCVVFTLDKEDLTELFKDYPQLAIITSAILKRFLMYTQHRVDSLLFETAEEKYEKLLSDIPKVLLRAPSIYVASFLGITPETLSRVRAKMAKR